MREQRNAAREDLFQFVLAHIFFEIFKEMCQENATNIYARPNYVLKSALVLVKIPWCFFQGGIKTLGKFHENIQPKDESHVLVQMYIYYSLEVKKYI